MIEYYCLMALTANGQMYLDAEQVLVTQGKAAVPCLQEQLINTVEFDRQVIEIILERIHGNKTFEGVIDFFEETERETTPTAKGAPSPEWVAGKLFQEFGGQAAPLLGVYLNKLASIWANWKIMGVILYLGKLNSKASADTLMRFLTDTSSEHYAKFALESLVAVGDASVLNRLEIELKSYALAQGRLQSAVDKIKSKLGQQASP